MAAKRKPRQKGGKPGQPTAYRAEYVEQARKLCLLGATDKDLADFFSVSEKTIGNWKLAHPEFRDSLVAGKAEIDAKVEQSLFRRATGYEHDAVKIIVVGGKVEQVPYVERYAPDTTACIFWLKNRKPDEWRDRAQLEHGVDDKLSALIEASWKH